MFDRFEQVLMAVSFVAFTYGVGYGLKVALLSGAAFVQELVGREA